MLIVAYEELNMWMYCISEIKPREIKHVDVMYEQVNHENWNVDEMYEKFRHEKLNMWM